MKCLRNTNESRKILRRVWYLGRKPWQYFCEKFLESICNLSLIKRFNAVCNYCFWKSIINRFSFTNNFFYCMLYYVHILQTILYSFSVVRFFLIFLWVKYFVMSILIFILDGSCFKKFVIILLISFRSPWRALIIHGFKTVFNRNFIITS